MTKNEIKEIKKMYEQVISKKEYEVIIKKKSENIDNFSSEKNYIIIDIYDDIL